MDGAFIDTASRVSQIEGQKVTYSKILKILFFEFGFRLKLKPIRGLVMSDLFEMYISFTDKSCISKQKAESLIYDKVPNL